MWGLVVLVVALILAGRPVADGERLEVVCTSVALDVTTPEREDGGRLVYRGGLWLAATLDRFGGLSDLRLSRDRRSMTAISDCGDVFTATLAYDESGRLIRVEDVTMAPIGAGTLSPGKDERDAEALVALPDGTWLVAFERRHRIAHFAAGTPPLSTSIGHLALPDDVLAVAGKNSGLEGLALLADGRLLALAEGAAMGRDMTRLWIKDDTGWLGFDYPLERDPGTLTPFRPTSAAGLANGDILVLERRYPPIGVRVRRIMANLLRPGAHLSGEEIARFDPPMTVDNFEGIDAALGPSGETLVYLLSDDNGCQGRAPSPLPPQRTLLLMFELREDDNEPPAAPSPKGRGPER